MVELEQEGADKIMRRESMNFRRSGHHPQTVVYTVTAATAFLYKYLFRTHKFLYVFMFQLCNIILNNLRQHNHFITQGNYKATCFDYRLVILRPILPIVSQDAMHSLGPRRVYIHGIHQIKYFVSKGVTCKLETNDLI